MLIDKVFPQVVAAKATLADAFMAAANDASIAAEQAKNVLNWLTGSLANADCFLDRMTSLWRYEFGIPFDVSTKLVWGTHMWPPVRELMCALLTARQRLGDEQLKQYVERLTDEKRHRATMVEMIPADKIDASISMEFEVSGHGVGKRTVDWLIRGPDTRLVLLDVKHRDADFVKAMASDETGSVAQTPAHDPALLFRSVPEKFVAADPAVQLQGAWICTQIKQPKETLESTFNALDPARVHFVILGDWEGDGCILVRRPEDFPYLLELFRLQQSDRFTFPAEAHTA